HRDLIRVTIQGSSGFDVRQINPDSVTLDGVHAIAHVTRKVRRSEFPLATYVFRANELSLPKGLNTVTLAGSLLNSTTTFQSSRPVLNLPDSARASGQLRKYMGSGPSLYGRLAKVEASHPETVINLSGGAAPASRGAPARTGLKVHYTP